MRLGGSGSELAGSDTEDEYVSYDQHASQNLVTRLINKILFRPGTQSFVSRIVRGSHGLDSRATRLLTGGLQGVARGGSSKRPVTLSADALLADAPPRAENSVPLISGFRAFMEKEQLGESRGYGRRSESDPDPEFHPHAHVSPADNLDVTPMLLSSERFDALVEATPKELRSRVLNERTNEYSEYLRRLEQARNALVVKLEDIDNRIMQTVEERRIIEERLSSELQMDRRRRRSSRSTTGGTKSRSQSLVRSDLSLRSGKRTDDGIVPKATVEEVSDIDDDAAGDGVYYEQSDTPRLRKLQSVYRGHYAGITAIDCDPVMGTIASGSLDTQVRVWDMETTECKHVISGHNDVIRGVQFYERFLLTASNDSRIRMWDLAMLESVRPRPSTKVMQREYVSASLGDCEDDGSRAESPDAIMSLQSTTPAVTPTICRHISPVELCCENTFIGHTDAVACFQAAPGGTMISGSADKTVREWDLNTGALRQTIDITWAIKDTQSARLSAGSIAGMASTASTASTMQRQNSPWTTAAGKGGALSTGTSRPSLPFDMQLQASEDANGPGSYKRGTELGDGGFVGALQFYDFALATGTADGFLRLWDLRTAQAHRQMHGHSEPITSIHFDDRSVITGSLDGTVLIWELRTGRVLQSLSFDSGLVSSVKLSPAMNGRAQKSYSVEFWAAARDNLLHHYMASSMQKISYASDYGYLNTRDNSRAAGGYSGISRIELLDESSLLCGDDEGVVKLWRI
ncbi:Mitochondrial fission protein [Coemansia sp. RSA 1933]|nr:Mitochondrial fission protein [Coemansia sp. RSA 1933]